MKKALFKDSLKEITKNFKRFISILLIVLLGVGFFAGIKATSPDMKLTLDEYFDEKNVYDVQVISTLGITEEDIGALKKVDGVENVNGSYSSDAIVNVWDEEVVVKIETITNEINNLEIIEGNLPQNENECVVEKAFLEGTNHKIGDQIVINAENIVDDDGNEKELLKNNTVTIVGTVKSPTYISRDRGTTKLGSGSINYYMYIKKDNINTDIYTNAYITVKGAKDEKCYKDKYEEKIENVSDKIEAISEERKEARYNELFNSANTKLQDAKAEFESQKAEGEQSLADAQKQIDDAKKELEEGKKELQTNKKQADNKFSEAEKSLESAKEQLKQQEEEFANKKAEAESQIKEYENNLNSLKSIQEQYNSLQTMLKTKQTEYSELEKKLAETSDQDEIANIKEQMAKVQIEIAGINESLKTIETQLQSQGIQDINETITVLETSIQKAKEELTNGQNLIDNAKKELENSESSLNNTKKETYSALNSAESKIASSEKEIKNAEEELIKAREEYNNKIADAEKKLDEAEEDVNSIERPDWYILNREQNAGYVSYIQDTDRVAKLAEVFPIVFFVVAALISLTSMTRMVEEQRVQIGTLKALGYNKLQIATKYIMYALLATVIGGFIGILIGFNFLPKVIADIYGMMYELPSVILEFNITYATMGLLAAMICTIGATMYACIRELHQNPSTLMRPKAPKAGKRVFLERIGFIWKRFNFTKKVTARNLFRYKKRFMMTIIGVGGCTALIISGFGLRDAITSMIPSQFGKVNLYEMSVNLKEEYKNSELENINQTLLGNENIENIIDVNVQSVKIDKDNNNQSIQLIVPRNTSDLNKFIALQSRTKKDEKYNLDNSGVIITEKLAKLLNIKVGDEITIINADDKKCNVKVSNITENYLMHYIYMTPELYNELYDTRIGYNVVYANTINLSESEENALGKDILSNKDYISGVSFTSASKDIFSEVMENMDLVVWILIIAAGLLAFVVLYNLINANITERIRELATIKVLGFYDKEVYNYISRETVILTVIGMLLGTSFGYFLTLYILKTCELDMLMFNPQITILSYFLGIIITAFFAIIVNIITYFSLKKIDMIESLKSVE